MHFSSSFKPKGDAKMIEYEGEKVGVQQIVKEMRADMDDARDQGISFNPVLWLRYQSPNLTDKEFRHVIETFFQKGGFYE
jgi:hypothetical protein